MSDIQLYPDGEQRRRIMDFIMAAGQTLLENGAEVFRVEQTMQIMARSLHLREFHVYVLTNGIFASAGTAEISEVRNVPDRTIHLGRVAAVNELSRELAEGRVGLFDYVTLYLPEDEEEMEVHLVTTLRVDAGGGHISRESPLGRAIFGRRVGETVTVQVNADVSYPVTIRAIRPGADDDSLPISQY